MKQKTGRTTEEQDTEDNQDVHGKKPTRTERGNTPEDIRYTQPELPAQARPPERSNNIRQNHPNTKKGQYQQGGTDHYTKMTKSDRNAKVDVRKVYEY